LNNRSLKPLLQVELATDRDELRSATADLESLVSDNLILAEKLEAKPPYPPHENWPSEKIPLEAWYVRSGWDMISPPKLSKNSIKTDAATYYTVPRSTLSDLLLHVCVPWELREQYGLLRLCWESQDSLYEKVMEGRSSREEFATASPGELSHYAFDRKYMHPMVPRSSYLRRVVIHAYCPCVSLLWLRFFRAH
jgi:hypothetical protein